RGRLFADLLHHALPGIRIGAYAEVHGRRRPAEHATPDLALGQPVPGIAVGVHRHVDVRGHGGADAAVNADHLAVQVEQRTARVAADERTIGLNEELVGVEHAAQSHHRRAPVLKTAGLSHGKAPLALLQIPGLAHLGERPFALLSDLDQAAV